MNSYEMEKTEVVKKELDRLQNLVIEKVNLFDLQSVDINSVDMLSIVIVGNSKSFKNDNIFVTPRGY